MEERGEFVCIVVDEIVGSYEHIYIYIFIHTNSNSKCVKEKYNSISIAYAAHC